MVAAARAKCEPLRRDVGKHWTSARVLVSRDFRYVGENGLPFEEWLVYCDNLRSVLELDRFPRDIKEGSTEWADANHLLTYLWSTYHETVNGECRASWL